MNSWMVHGLRPDAVNKLRTFYPSYTQLPPVTPLSVDKEVETDNKCIFTHVPSSHSEPVVTPKVDSGK